MHGQLKKLMKEAKALNIQLELLPCVFDRAKANTSRVQGQVHVLPGAARLALARRTCLWVRAPARLGVPTLGGQTRACPPTTQGSTL